MTILECRNSSLRLEALQILESWPHRKGFWNSGLSAMMARKVVDIEEAEEAEEMGQTATHVWLEVSESQDEGTLSLKLSEELGRVSDEMNSLSVDI